MAEQSEKPAAGKKSLIFIIAGAVIAVLVIVTITVLVVKGGGEKGKKAAETEQPAAHGGGEGGEGGAPAGAATVFPLEPFVVNIYDGQDIRYLRLKVEFEMGNPGAKAELEGRQAPIRDAILVLLTTKTLQDIQNLAGKNQLREEVLAAVNKIVTPGSVTRVYFTDFVVQ
jgi:flagellar FliL protein